MTENNILRSNIIPPEILFNSVGELIWHKLQNIDDSSICLIDSRTDEQLTIGELKSRANSIAVALIQRGIIKTDVIAFCGLNSIQHATLLFATYFLGITFMPLSPAFGEYEIEIDLKTAQANVIIASAKQLPKFKNSMDKNNVKLVVVFDGEHDKYVTFEQLLKDGRGRELDTIPHFNINPKSDIFLLMHTSGSTGPPKCAMLTHFGIMNMLSETNTFFHITEHTGNVVTLPFSFGHISGSVSLPVLTIGGATSVLLVNFNDEILLKSIEKYKITYLDILPILGPKFVVGDLVDKYDLSSAKYLSSGGSHFPANISKAIVDKYKLIFREGFGMTEYMFITRGEDVSAKFTPGNLGPVSPGTEVKIVDLNTGESLGPNSEGEICVRGNKMFAGYLNNEQATKDAFDEDGWFRTGDLGYYNEEERIFIKERIKEVILVVIDNTYANISPVEIEHFLMTNPSIEDAVIVGIANTTGNKWPRAYVVLRKGHVLTGKNIEKYVADTLAYTRQLKGGVVFVDHIQKTVIGKIDRKYYRNLVKDEIIE